MRPYERRTVMEDHGFYVTLPCNASSSVYPENRISSYTTRLAKAINLKGQWEVGLAEIEYPRSWYNFNDEDGHFILHTAPEPPDSNPSNIGFSIITKLYISGGYYANIRAILRAINQLIAPAAVLNHDELKNKVYLTAKPNISVSFRGRLATILGMTLKPLGGLNYHKEPDFTANVIMYAPHQCDINAGFYTMYVYTDIIQYQAVGDSYVPLLRCVHITGKGNDAVIARYDNPHYASISKDHITSIVIELKDDQNHKVPFSYGKVIVKLHFKPKNIYIL